MKITAPCLLLGVLAGSAGCSMHRNAHLAPTANVEMDASVLKKFDHEIGEYIEEHRCCRHNFVAPKSLNAAPTAALLSAARRPGPSPTFARRRRFSGFEPVSRPWEGGRAYMNEAVAASGQVGRS